MSLSQNAESCLRQLAAFPKHGSATVERADLKAIMLQTGGTMFACGELYDITSKPLGGGVYRLTLSRTSGREEG